MRNLFITAAFAASLFGGRCALGQSLQEELQADYPEYTTQIETLFQGNPRFIEPTLLSPDTATPYAVRFGLSHSIGQGVGNPTSFTSFESFLPLADSGGDGIVFLNPIVHLDNFGNPAVNVGLGARQLFDSWTPTVIGFSTWYDYRRSNLAEDFSQLSFSLEYLTDWIEIRSNIYIPDIGEDRRSLPNRFSGNSLLLGRAEVAMTGADVEVGTVLPAVGRLQGRIAAGYYHFDDPDVTAVTGWRVRSELAAHENLTSEVIVSDDDVFGTTVVMRLSLQSIQDILNPPGGMEYPPVHSFRRGDDSHLTTSVADRLIAEKNDLVEETRRRILAILSPEQTAGIPGNGSKSNRVPVLDGVELDENGIAKQKTRTLAPGKNNQNRPMFKSPGGASKEGSRSGGASSLDPTGSGKSGKSGDRD